MYYCNFVVVIILLVVSCILCAIGTPLPWVYFPEPFSRACVSLWGAKYDCSKDQYTVEWKDVDCEIRDYMMSAQTFAIVSTILSGVAAGISLILMIMKIRRLASGFLCFVSFGCTIITVALFAYPFTQKICGFPFIGVEIPPPPSIIPTPAPSTAEDIGKLIGPGFAMFIAAAISNFLALLIHLFGGCCCSSNDPKS